MIRRITLSMFLILVCLIAPSYAITTMIGLYANGPTPAYPMSFNTLCAAGGANCPKTFHPSWTVSTRFWGSDGSNCVTSIDSGATWTTCAAQPFGGTAVQVASAVDGSVLAVSSVAGTCTIKRSTDNAATWNTQYTDANQCNFASGASQLIKCQDGVTSSRCEYIFILANTTTRLYTSTDNGVTWAQTNSANVNLLSAVSLYTDGAVGIVAPASGASGRVVPLESSGTWALSSGWPAATGNYNCSGSAIYGTTLSIFCYDIVAQNYKRINSSGAILNTFTPVGAVVLSSSALSALEVVSGSVSYLVGTTTSGGQAFWISTDNLTTTISLATNAAISGIATMYYIHGAVYISIAGGTGSFHKVS